MMNLYTITINSKEVAAVEAFDLNHAIEEGMNAVQAQHKGEMTFDTNSVNVQVSTELYNTTDFDVMTVTEVVAPVVEEEVKELTTLDKIFNQVAEQGYKVSYTSDCSLTIAAWSHDVSVTVLDNGQFFCETFRDHSIEHFATGEWANAKTIKTVRGLNGYLGRFGAGRVAL